MLPYCSEVIAQGFAMAIQPNNRYLTEAKQILA